MDPSERARKKRREAQRLRGLGPGETLEMGFSLCEFGRELAEAADDARD